jgi:uncharacterized protein (DUF302 family)
MTQSLRADGAGGRYAFGVRVPYGHAEAVTRTKEALKSEGFGVLTEIDIQKAMREKVDHQMGRYLILGACNPQLARRALQEEQEIGALLPCNVVVYEDAEAGGETVVIAQDPRPMLETVGNQALAAVATEARARLQRALGSLGGRPR